MSDPDQDRAASDVEADPHVAASRADRDKDGSYVGSQGSGRRFRQRENRRRTQSQRRLTLVPLVLLLGGIALPPMSTLIVSVNLASSQLTDDNKTETGQTSKVVVLPTI
jgi:hypothetical protein